MMKMYLFLLAIVVSLPRARVRTAWSSLINPTEKCVVNFILTSKQQKCADEIYVTHSDLLRLGWLIDNWGGSSHPISIIARYF
jgi:hypothetical protein